MKTLPDQKQIVINILQAFDKQKSQHMGLLKRIARVPSQTFAERTKAQFIKTYLHRLGIASKIDEKNTVWGALISKKNSAKRVLAVAHIDTVFSCTGTVKETAEHLYGHGTCDNSAGVTSLLIILEYIQKYSLTFPSDLYFAFTAQEEGLGFKGGMRYMMAHLPPIDAVINLESHNIGRITNQCVGQHRVKITVTTSSAGHAFREFGLPNAIVIMSVCIGLWAKVRGFKKNKSTYNMGKISGGAGINSIAKQAELLMEIRSVKQEVLAKFEHKLETLLRVVQSRYLGVSITKTVLSEVKAVRFSFSHPLYHIVRDVQKQLGITGHFDAGNTDGDVSLGKNIPTVTLGTAIGYKTHSMDEYMKKKSFSLGMKQNFLVLYAVLHKYSVL